MMDCELSLSGVANSSVQIIVRSRVPDTHQKVMTTFQLCYMARGLDRMILSEEASRDLGLVDRDFPAVGSSESRASDTPWPGLDQRSH